MQNIADMTDADSQALLNVISSIMNKADDGASAGNSECYSIYKLARDARDILTFDAVSRDVLAKLGAAPDPIVRGLRMSSDVLTEIRAGRKIHAIKELRNSTSCSLIDAKNAVEAVWDQYAVPF